MKSQILQIENSLIQVNAANNNFKKPNLVQSTVSGVLTAKINQLEKPPAVTVNNPFRSWLLENKDLTSLTKSASKPGTSRQKNSFQKKKQVLKQNVIAGVQGNRLYKKQIFL